MFQPKFSNSPSSKDEDENHVHHVAVDISDSGTDRNKNDTEARKEEKQKAAVTEIVAASSSDNTRSRRLSDDDNNSEMDEKQDSDGNKSGDQTDFDTAGHHREIDDWIPVREEVLSFIPDDIQREDSNLEDDGLTLLRRLSHAARGGLASLRRPSHATRGGLASLRRLSHTARAPNNKHIHDAKLTHMQTLEIVRKLCPNAVAWRTKRAEQALSKPFLAAARFGIYELVEEILVADFNSFAFIDNETGHDILQISIIYRQEEVFSLLNKMNLCLWHWKAANPRAESNILHLAGGLVPSTKVSGAALQMQRELQWFKAVESYVHPSLREQRNESGQTPREVFTKNHESLVKEGEKWMKETATSCTIVAALIITVAFAAAFTVPGGNDARGIPNFLHKPSFIVFTISDALALFSSTASVLIFLGILTSRYSEEDFLESLPRKLIVGHITLFLSILSMMVAFGAAVYILLSDLWPPVYIPIAILGVLTVYIFARLQFPLLIEMYLSTYRSGIYQGTK